MRETETHVGCLKLRSERMIYWMTGLSGSGKTTIAKGVEKLRPVEVLEGDTLRDGLCKGLGYSPAGRTENLRRIAHLATYLNKYTDVIVACITPYESARKMVRSLCVDLRTVFIKASLAECIKRDPKGLYVRAQRGEIGDLTGLGDIFEPPHDADLVIETEKQTPAESIAELLRYMCADCKRYALFVGRWQPFHRGHDHLLRKQLRAGKDVAIAVRDTPLGRDDPFPLPIRIQIIRAAFKDEVEAGRVIVFPIVDVESVNIGRNVGYHVNEVEVPNDVKSISASEIRRLMVRGEQWRQLVPATTVEILERARIYLC